MKKIIFMGKSGAGKTTLTQRIKNMPPTYHKTQYVTYGDVVIDTPGEYAENKHLASALALYSYEADVVGLIISAEDQFSLFPPNITCLVNREVIGVVTHVGCKVANPERAGRWLKNSGCKKIFYIDSKTDDGIASLLEYLEQD